MLVVANANDTLPPTFTPHLRYSNPITFACAAVSRSHVPLRWTAPLIPPTSFSVLLAILIFAFFRFSPVLTCLNKQTSTSCRFVCVSGGVCGLWYGSSQSVVEWRKQNHERIGIRRMCVGPATLSITDHISHSLTTTSPSTSTIRNGSITAIDAAACWPITI
jgi:hypothetical protein